MSETKNLRNTLLHTDVKKSCCAVAELSGMILCVPSVLDSDDVDIQSRIKYLSKKKQGAEMSTQQCCNKAFLKGAFQVSGTVSDPASKSPYVEVYFLNKDDAEKYQSILTDFGIKSGVSKRRNKFVCYIKNSEGISDYLLLIDAPGESLKFMVSKTEREVINNSNRATNFDFANISRTTKKYDEEVKHIELLQKSGRLSNLPEKLRELAILRINNPYYSYTELGNNLSVKCSKSTVSLRMNQIMEEK